MSSKISALSANAVLAKARAMYADVLTDENYKELAACRTVSEAAGYLKGKTAYRAAFEGLPGGNIHRARMENILKKYRMTRLAELCAYERAIGLPLHEVFFWKNDVDSILTCADHLDSQSIGEYMLYIPEFFKAHSELDIASLERARSVQELHAALAGTPYQRLLEPFVNGQLEFSVLILENILYGYLYTQAAALVRKNYGGAEREAILDFFRMRADMQTVERIYRRKRYFGSQELLHGGISGFTESGFTKNEQNDMLAAETPEAVLRVVQSSCYGKYLPEGGAVIEQKTQTVALRINQKNLHYSAYPAVVMLSFSGILENEMRNVTHIVEGVRYALGQEEILQYLV